MYPNPPSDRPQRRLLALLAYMPAVQAAPLLSRMFRETPPEAAAWATVGEADYEEVCEELAVCSQRLAELEAAKPGTP